MDPTQICPACGKPMMPGAAQGLCPKCLMKSGFETRAGKDSPGGKSGPDSPSVAQLAGLFPQLEIRCLIGQGGMGAVYQARQLSLNRFVAFKILSPAKQNDPHFVERFQREARTLASLNHPNITAVYDFGETQGYCFLLMELVEGQNLRQLLKERRLPTAEALAIIPQICQALQYAHERGIVHRDIKPENILLDTAGRVKITDFGIAKLLDPEPQNVSLTGVRDIVGTPHYMAPEQIEKPLSVDHRADIYSLGVVFYEILTGELPIGKFQPPSQKVHLDARLDEVVLRALEKEPQSRYQNVAGIRSDVETILATPGQAASLPSAGGPPAGRRAPWRKSIVIGVFVLILLGGLLALLVPEKHRPAAPPAEGLVSLWSGEKDAADSIGMNHGKPVNVTFTQGIFGHAFHLNGSNAYVQIPDAPALRPEDLTVEAWVKFDGQKSLDVFQSKLQYIVFKLNTRSPHRGNFEGYCLAKDGAHFSFAITSPEGQQVCASSITAAQPGVWYHLAGKYCNLLSNLEIYVNGTLEGSAYAGFPLDCGTRPLFIGTTGEWWDGKLAGAVDEVALYNQALTVNEIYQHYEAVRSRNPRLVPSTQTAAMMGPIQTEVTASNENVFYATASKSLVAHWSAAANGKDLAGTNDARLDQVTFAETAAGRTFVFNGTNASIRVPASPGLNVGLGDGFTIAAWIRPEGANLMSIGEWNQNNGIPAGTKQIGSLLMFYGARDEAALVGALVDTNAITHNIVTTNGVIVPNQFQQVAITYDKARGIAMLYKDGAVVARVNLGSFTPQTSFDFFIGNRPSGSFAGAYFQGQMDDIAIYNRALTATEVRAGYDVVRCRFFPVK
jgi:predicted Ser/Thr protein kinase